ncbi:MAG: hypothetical protein NT027_09190 [Proteobacteria bacterium]|nr:hypothetical protein [Pseudomonadota bacterium]
MLKKPTIAFSIAAALCWSCGPQELDLSTPESSKRNNDTDDPFADSTANEDGSTPTSDPALTIDKCVDLNSLPTSPEAISKALNLESFSKSFRKNGVLSNLTNLVPVKFSGKMSLINSLNSFNLNQFVTPLPLLKSDDLTQFLKNTVTGIQANIIPQSSRTALATTNKEWTNLSCIFNPATKITKPGSNNFAIELSKAIPLGLNPSMNYLDLLSTLNNKSQFTDIVASISSSQISNLPVGKSYKGNVTIDKITDPINSDLVTLKIGYNFGGTSINSIIGLPVSMSWTINKQTKAVISVEVDVGNGKILKFK